MSYDSVKAAFEKQVVLLPLDIIVPQREVNRAGEIAFAPYREGVYNDCRELRVYCAGTRTRSNSGLL